jgi:hypothetical protein
MVPLEKNKVGLVCYIYYDFYMIVLYKIVPQNMEGKITKIWFVHVNII